MNGSPMLGAAALAGGMLGALLGGLFAWRWLSARLVREVSLQLHAAMAPLLQSHLECMRSDIAQAVAVPAIAPSWVETVLQATTAAAAHTQRAEQGVRDAMASASAALASHEAVQQATSRALQDALRRVPQTSQQTPKVETAAPAAALIAPAVISMPVPPTFPSALPSVSARPPEWLLTPVPQPKPVYDDEPEPMRELSDEEIDALPPDLPVADKARKRILPTPKRPVLRNL
jgi:hypothetical protein